jgi:hypothetical protein
LKLTRCEVWKPTSSCSRPCRLRSVRPAAITSAAASATSTIVRPSRTRPVVRLSETRFEPRTPSEPRSVIATSAGAEPTTSVTMTSMATVNSAAGRSSAMLSSLGTLAGA